MDTTIHLNFFMNFRCAVRDDLVWSREVAADELISGPRHGNTSVQAIEVGLRKLHTANPVEASAAVRVERADEDARHRLCQAQYVEGHESRHGLVKVNDVERLSL